MRFAKIAAAALSVALLPTAQAFAWGDGGHMIVARIAYSRLTPRASAEADRLIALSIEPAAISKDAGDFVHASIWADAVRGESGFEDTADLHYVDNPFSQDGTPLPGDLPKPRNIVVALKEETALLRSRAAKPGERARALRFLIHFVGDIHQPLHCATRVSTRRATGLKRGRAPSEAYVREGSRIARKRVVWAGYRLASLLNALLGEP